MIQFRFAGKGDNNQLLELTRASGMVADTSLRIERQPDFFGLLNLRGESRVLVATNESGRIVGSISVSLQQVYIGSDIHPVHYVGDFRVAPDHQGTGIGVLLCNQLTEYMLSVNADLVFLTVAKGNTRPFPFFRARPNIPDFKNIGTFLVHQFIGSSRKISLPGYDFGPGSGSSEILGYLNDHYSRYELGAVITERQLDNADIYQLSRNGKIVGILCLADTMSVKQNIVLRLPMRLKYLLKIMNGSADFFGLSKMPSIHEPVRMLYIKYLWVKNSEKRLLRFLVNRARHIAYQKGYSFASLGLHEKDPVNQFLQGMAKLTFHSTGMFLSIKNNQEIMTKVMEGIPFEDYSLV